MSNHTDIVLGGPGGRKKVLFLYQELSGYFMACLDAFLKEYPVEAIVIRWEVNPVAPFQFREPEGCKFLKRAGMGYSDIEKVFLEFKPDLVFCGGWADNLYFRLAKIHGRRVPFVLALDNHWRGNIRQQLMSFFGGNLITQVFSHAWIPGVPQYEFVRRIGFPNERIRFGLYSCDFPLFDGAFLDHANEMKNFPRSFWFAGRFIKEKGLLDLFDAFLGSNLIREKGWDLKIVGKGDLEDQIPDDERIHVSPFLQPKALSLAMAAGGVFVLPSHYEAWGVVVHEFASAGFPLVCSWNVGAATAFLRNGFNGFFHDFGNPVSLRSALERVASLEESELWEMSRRSRVLGRGINTASWSSELWELIP